MFFNSIFGTYFKFWNLFLNVDVYNGVRISKIELHKIIINLKLKYFLYLNTNLENLTFIKFVKLN